MTTKKKIGLRRSGQSGQALVLIALMMTGICGFAALAIDLGFYQNQKRQMQTAADSAAMAAARELSSGNSSNEITAATQDATTNGFTQGTVGGVTTTVTVQAPQSGNPFHGTSNAVEVDISQTQPSLLVAAIGMSTVTITASATAAPAGQPACFYALDPSASGAVQAVGNVTLNSACGMLVDSNSNSALSIVGNATVTGTQIGIVGNYSFTGNVTVNPTPVTGMAVQSDPLSSVAAPAFAAGHCDQTNYSQVGNLNLTISPGVYCGGITLTGNVNLTLNPGTYIINGGGLTLVGNSTITGTGVTIYLTGTAATYKGVSITGNNSASLTAPTSGPLEGILFFEDRTISSATGSAHPNSFTGNASEKLQGALYFPKSELDYVGNASAAYTIVVADTIHFTGNASLNGDYSSLQDGSPIKAANPLAPVALAQ